MTGERGSSRSQPSGRPSADAEVTAGRNAEPSENWEATATAVVEAIASAVEPRLRRAADDIYQDLLYTVQDYLMDNVLRNVQSQIDAASRQANLDRLRAIEAERVCETLRSALLTCVHRIESPNLSPDANVVLERARAALAKATSTPA